MNKKTINLLATAFAALAITASTHAAGFTNTFDAGPLDPTYLQDCAWSAGPIGWAGAGAMRNTATNGGFLLGATGIKITFNETEKTAIREAIATGQGQISFDLLFDGTSFNANAQWYQAQIAGNSATGGWKQQEKLVDWWQNAGQSDLRVQHVVTNLSDIGWTDATGVWYELYMGANSDAANPINFWVDNLAVSTGGAVVTSQIVITAYSRSGGNMNISGTGSPAGVAWRCLSSANVTAAIGSWTQVGSGTLSGGTFSLSVTVPEDTARYYRMVTP